MPEDPIKENEPVERVAPMAQSSAASVEASPVVEEVIQTESVDVVVLEPLAVEVERERAYERNRAASALLPIVDNLDLALEHAAADPRSLIQGLLAVRDQAVNALAMLGFPRRDDLGVHFDPSRHEAVGSVPGADAAPGTVVAVVRPGYGEGDRQLRPAAVVVATGGSSGEAEEGS